MLVLTCDYCKQESWKPMCDCCAEADEAGILTQYLAGEESCPACAESKRQWLALYS